MATKDIIFSVSEDNEFRVRLHVWSSSSINFLSYLKETLKLIDDSTYMNLNKLETPVYEIDDDTATKITQMANKLGLQIIPNFNIGIKSTIAS